jgi:hypothetical protein
LWLVFWTVEIKPNLIVTADLRRTIIPPAHNRQEYDPQHHADPHKPTNGGIADRGQDNHDNQKDEAYLVSSHA